MQTFLPSSDFCLSAEWLDKQRLWKQVLETHQILNVLLKRTGSKGWQNHPAVLMWKGYEEALKLYYNTFLFEWFRRGGKTKLLIEKIDPANLNFPTWLGNEEFHSSHRMALLGKAQKKLDLTGKRDMIEWYGQWNWPEKPLSSSEGYYKYIWPTQKKV